MKIRIPSHLKKMLLIAMTGGINISISEEISTKEELRNSFDTGGSFVVSQNITLDANESYFNLKDNKTLAIDLSGKLINWNNSRGSLSVYSGSTLMISNGTLNGYNFPVSYTSLISNSGTTILDNVTIDGKNTGMKGIAIINRGTADQYAYFTMNGGAISNHILPYGSGRQFSAAFYNSAGYSIYSYSFASFDGVGFFNNVNEQGYGGAIANGSDSGVAVLDITNCVFDGNIATERVTYPNPTDTSVGGGAIANIWGTVTIVDSTFKNNYADLGGAIINRYFMTIRADEKDVLFSNNHIINTRGEDDFKGANDIYLNSGFSGEYPDHLNKTYLQAKNGRIIFEGGIRGLNVNMFGVVNKDDNRVIINQTSDGVEYEGDVIFRKTAIVESTNFELYNGRLVIEDGDVFYNERNRLDPTKDKYFLYKRNNFAMHGGILDLSRLLSGTFSVESLILNQGTVRFGMVREYSNESLITGTYGWADGATSEIVFHSECLGHLNKKEDYVLLDYVNEALTDDDLGRFSLIAEQYGEGWELLISDGDLVLHWDGEDEQGVCPDPHPVDPECPGSGGKVEPGGERVGYIVENSLWSSDSNVRSMGMVAFNQLNMYRMKNLQCRNVWMKGLGDFSRLSSHGGIDGYEYSGGGYAVGMDTCVCRSLGYVGVSFGEIWGKMKSRDYNSSISQRSDMATLYWGKLRELNEKRAWLFKGAATYGYTDNRLKSYYSDGGYSRAKWNNKTWYLQAEAAYHMKAGDGWSFAPFAGIDYSHGNRGDFVDSNNSSSNHHYMSSRLQRLTLPIGLEINKTGSIGEKPWFNGIKLSYVGDVYRNNPESTAFSYPDGSYWDVKSAKMARNAFRAEYYTMIMLDEHWNINAGYGMEARSGSIHHQVNAGASYTF